MTCPCDIAVFPRPLVIPAGLGPAALRNARTLGLFPDWRLALLGAVGGRPELDAWRARDRADLGLMLLEMGAYVFDVVDFYTALGAGEGFIRTAELAGAQRKLVALLGYRPRPAVGALAFLAAEAEGRRVVSLPAGTAFRSGEFAGNPPQVFELEAPASIDPRANRFGVEPVAQDATASATLASLLVDPASVRVRAGDALVLDFAGTLRTAKVAGVAPVSLRSKAPAARLTLASPVSVPAGAKHSTLRLWSSGGTLGLWKLGQIGADTETAVSGANVLLESVAPVRAGQLVLFEREGTLAAHRVVSAVEIQRTLLAALSSTIKDTSNVVQGTVESPPIKVMVLGLTLDSGLGWSSGDAAKIVVHYPLVPAARVLVPLKDTLEVLDEVTLPSLVDAPRVEVKRLLLEDVHQEGVLAGGSLDAAAHKAVIAQGEEWGKALTAPVTVFGNVLEVSRGESVRGEVLGVGDATLARQSFTLKKKPLTYLPAATASGIRSTLSVRVAGILWREVESFYGARDDERVYLVRHDEAGETQVVFGGGARLPSGARVTADYRFGAGGALPPAGSITQLARPFPGVASVRNVLPAFGGAEAESPRELAAYGPRSALLLGRAVSLPDLEAAAAAVPGVRAARAQWRWDAAGMRAAAQVQYIGSAQLRETIRARLRALAEPDAPIAVVRSLPQPARLELDLEIDREHVVEDVIAAVREALYAPADLPGSGGLLRPERLGPEGVVFLSQVMAAVTAVAGVAGVRAVALDGTPFAQSGRQPAAGSYFDFGEPGTPASGLLINGVP